MERSVRPLFSFILLSRSFDARRHTLTHVVPCLQMSSEDSSNRVDSGNAFKGDSLYRSSPGGRQTPDFSWTEFSQKDSASRWHEAAEGSFRLEGEQGNDEASSSDQIEWSCAYSISTFTLRDALRLLDQYGMQVSIPQEVEKAHRPLRDT